MQFFVIKRRQLTYIQQAAILVSSSLTYFSGVLLFYNTAMNQLFDMKEGCFIVIVSTHDCPCSLVSYIMDCKKSHILAANKLRRNHHCRSVVNGVANVVEF